MLYGSGSHTGDREGFLKDREKLLRLASCSHIDRILAPFIPKLQTLPT